MDIMDYQVKAKRTVNKNIINKCEENYGKSKFNSKWSIC